MLKFFITFAQCYAHREHPTFPKKEGIDAHPDGWVELIAETEKQAHRYMLIHHGINFDMTVEDEWNPAPGQHPLGKLDTIDLTI